MPERRNNFDLLRLFFAVSVFFAHIAILTGKAELSFLQRMFNATLAVDGFFIISGFLIFQSYEKSRSFFHYAEKRIRRIYPAYITVILLSILLGAILTSSPAFFSGETTKYLLANLVFLNFLHPELPGIFQDHIFTAVNGALWTLKIEVMFYASVPCIVWLCRYIPRLPLFIFIYIASCTYAFLLSGSHAELARQLPGQLCFFISGGALYYYFERIKPFAHALFLFSLLGYVAGTHFNITFLTPLCLAMIVIYVAKIFPYLGNAARFGDLSYGIYILHFPVVQMFISLGIFTVMPLPLALASVISCVAGLAFLLWHGIEKHFLQKSSHYIVRTA